MSSQRSSLGVNQLKVAVIQLNAGPNKSKNIQKALKLSKEAIQKKAEWVLLPEVFHYRGRESGILENAETLQGPTIQNFKVLAKDHKVFILLGSITERIPKSKKVYNTSILIDPQGKIKAKYRKKHLFRLRGQVDETRNFKAGHASVVSKVGGFSIGMSICFDLRFSSLYHAYARKKVHVLTIPSSFTHATGKAHWEALVRARAIENQCYVLAPNQYGVSTNKIKTYGNSMIVDPWGRVLARASGSKEAVLMATLSLDMIKKVRHDIPTIINF